MAKKKKDHSKAKARAKTTAKVVVGAYAGRVQWSARRGARKAAVAAVHSDLKRVGRGIERAGNTKAGRKIGNSRPAVGAAIYGVRAADRFSDGAKTAGKAADKVGERLFTKKGAVVVGSAVVVGGGAYAATRAYKRRKAKNASANGTITYKRRTKSGKVITVSRRRGGKR